MRRDSSAEAYQEHELSGEAGTKRQRILNYLAKRGATSRRQIAQALGYDTATVSGLVTPMLKDNGPLIEQGYKQECPVTRRMVYFVGLEPKQEELL